jgi:putative membrane protein
MSLLSILAQQWRPWHGDHMTGGGWGMIVLWILILAVLIFGVFAIVRRGGPRDGEPPGGRQDRAEEALREQYARGEVDEETYRRRLEELRRH